jgi:transposase
VGDLRALADDPLLAWRAFAQEPSAQIGRHTLDLPDRSAVARLAGVFGKWNSVWKQFCRWCESGAWDLLLQALADSGGALDMLQMIDSTTVRAHRCAAGEKTEEQNQALGRSRGGFSTKIHARCDAAGLPIGIVLTEGEAHDVTAYDGLMQQRDSDPCAMLADKWLRQRCHPP